MCVNGQLFGSCLQVGNITKSHKESHIEKEEKRVERMSDR